MGNPTQGEKIAEQHAWAAQWQGPDGYSWEPDPMADGPSYRERHGLHALSGDTGGFVRDSQTGNSWDLEDGWQADSGWGADE